MSFSQAFKYPFRNFAKVFSIVLVLTIAFAAFIALIMNSYDWVELWNSLAADDLVEYATHDLESFTPAVFIGVLGVLVVAIVAGFWLSGYSVAVIRSLIDGEEVMPDISFSRNMKDGAYLFIASLAYWILFAIAIIVAGIAGGIAGSLQFLGVLVVIAALIIMIVIACLMGWGYFIGMARFAVEGDYRASWQIWRNMRMARREWKAGIGLEIYWVLLTIAYGVLRTLPTGYLAGLAARTCLLG